MVRHRILIPTFAGSIPASPANTLKAHVCYINTKYIAAGAFLLPSSFRLHLFFIPSQDLIRLNDA